MKSALDKLGQWPVSGPEARRKKQIALIKEDQSLSFIHGKENHVLVSFFVSNDFIHVGTMIIPANQVSDAEEHKGDEVLYVLEGSISLLVAKDWQEQKPVTMKRFEVSQGERFLIPEGFKHQYLNFSDDVAKLLFAIAPEL